MRYFDSVSNGVENKIPESEKCTDKIKDDGGGDELSPFSKPGLAGFVLIFSAGWVNIQGLKLGILDSLSYVTGRGVRIGTAMFEGDISSLIYIFFTLSFYIFGAYLGAKITQKKGIGYALIVTSLLLFSVPVLLLYRDFQFVSDMSSYSLSEEFVLMATIFMTLIGMGAMNGSTSMTSIGRTTHLTGAATDIGVNLAIGKRRTAMFHLLRWVGFFMGAFSAMCLYSVWSSNHSLLTTFPLVPIVLAGLLLQNSKL